MVIEIKAYLYKNKVVVDKKELVGVNESEISEVTLYLNDEFLENTYFETILMDK